MQTRRLLCFTLCVVKMWNNIGVLAGLHVMEKYLGKMHETLFVPERIGVLRKSRIFYITD